MLFVARTRQGRFMLDINKFYAVKLQLYIEQGLLIREGEISK